jgi:hypothetical protein
MPGSLEWVKTTREVADSLSVSPELAYSSVTSGWHPISLGCHPIPFCGRFQSGPMGRTIFNRTFSHGCAALHRGLFSYAPYGSWADGAFAKTAAGPYSALSTGAGLKGCRLCGNPPLPLESDMAGFVLDASVRLGAKGLPLPDACGGHYKCSCRTADADEGR